MKRFIATAFFLFWAGVLSSYKANFVSAYVCSDNYYFGCGSPDTYSGCWEGDGCDYSCPFADPNRCDGGDESGGGGGGSGPYVEYKVKIYVYWDANNNGTLDPYPTDRLVSREGLCQTPLWLSPANVPLFRRGVVRSSNRIDLTSNTYSHPVRDGGHYCEVLTGMARSRFSFYDSSPGNQVIWFFLNDTPQLGQQAFRIVSSSISGPSLCTTITNPMNDYDTGQPLPIAGYENSLRNRFFLCNPPNPATRSPEELVRIRILISNRNTVPQCMAAWCDPPSSPPVIVTPAGYHPVGLGFQMSNYVQSGTTVRFSSSNPNVIDFSQDQSDVQPQIVVAPSLSGSRVFQYQSYTQGWISTNPGSCGTPTTINARVVSPSGNVLCQCNTGQITVQCLPHPSAWWQVVGGDSVAYNGNIDSKVFSDQPPTREMIATDYWGMPIFTGLLANPAATSNLGTPGWKADTATYAHRTARGTPYDYDYFADKFIPPADNLAATDGVIANAAYLTSNTGVPHDDYQTYRRNGNLTISGNLDFTQAAVGTKKIIIFVEGNLNINGKILLDDGLDFIMFVVRGNINVNPLVGDAPAPETTSTPDVEGIYVTNQVFNTGNGSNQLHVRGIVTGYGSGGANNGINFQRNLLASNEYPAERFQYASDQLLLFPPFFSEKTISWKEVIP